MANDSSPVQLCDLWQSENFSRLPQRLQTLAIKSEHAIASAGLSRLHWFSDDYKAAIATVAHDEKLPIMLHISGCQILDGGDR